MWNDGDIDAGAEKPGLSGNLKRWREALKAAENLSPDERREFLSVVEHDISELKEHDPAEAHSDDDASVTSPAEA